MKEPEKELSKKLNRTLQHMEQQKEEFRRS